MTSPTPLRVRFDDFELDEANARLWRGGEPVVIPPKPFSLLCELARAPGALLSKLQLLDVVWGHQFVSDSVLKTAISEIRAALGDDPRSPHLIETVSRRGYRFIGKIVATPIPSTPRVNEPDSATPAPAPFVGRAAALAQLHSAWNVACSGKRSMVWIAGEPGIGKTSLIERFVESLGDVAVGRGQCVEHYGAAEPYLPVFESIAELCRSDERLPDLLRSVAPAWLVQLPWLSTVSERERLRLELSGVGPERMLREMGEVMDRYTALRPVLLITEDLHWGDRSTLQLIDYVARRRGNARLMWLASYRLTDVVGLDHPLNAIRHELRRHQLCDEIVLDAFSETEVAEFLATRAEHLVTDEAFVRALHDRSDGVPLFVASIVREILAARPREAGDDAAALVRSTIPENLIGIIEHYLAQLDEERRQVLCAAAVYGLEFRVDTIADALERDAVSVEHICEALARERLWLTVSRPKDGRGSPVRKYVFAHGLFRQVLYDHIPPLTRAHLHRELGAALERDREKGRPVASAELAVHFASGGDALKAARHLAEAADAALANLSPSECMSLAEQGLTLLGRVNAGPAKDDAEAVLQTLRGVAAIQVAGLDDETRAAFTRAFTLLGSRPDHPLRGRVMNGLATVLFLRAEYKEALEVGAQAMNYLSTSDEPLLRLTSVTVDGQVNMLLGRPALGRLRIEEALPWFETLDIGSLRGLALAPQVTLPAILGLHLLHLGLVEQGRARLREARTNASRLAQPMAQMVAVWYETMFELRLDDVERVAALAGEMHVLAEEFALARGLTGWRWFHGWAMARAGSPLEGFRWIRDAYEENLRLGMLSGASENLGYAAEARLRAGDLEGAQSQIDEAMAFVDRTGERIYLPQLLLTEAAIARAGDRPAAAIETIRRAITESQAQGARWLEFVSLLALVESDGASLEDHTALADIVAQLPEISATRAGLRARDLIAATTRT